MGRMANHPVGTESAASSALRRWHGARFALVFVLVLACLALFVPLLVACSKGASDSSATPATEEEAKASVAGGELKVHYFDVGQGDSQFLEFPDGTTMLIDAGPTDAGEGVVQKIKDLGHDEIDILVASHPDSDHIGGLRYPLREMKVGEVWAPNVSKDTYAYEKFLKAVDGQHLTIQRAESGKTIKEGEGYSIELLGPDMSRQGQDSDANSFSTIIRVQFGDTSFLFTGDAYKDQIDRAEQDYVDVLKVAHHGSYSGTDAKLIEQLQPSLAIIQYAEDNPYGYPHDEVRKALADVPTYGNAENGDITVTSDGWELTVSICRGEALW